MTETNPVSTPQTSHALTLAFAWLAVLVPLAWGVAQTVKKALALFG